jgi:hypothetical protein
VRKPEAPALKRRRLWEGVFCVVLCLSSNFYLLGGVSLSFFAYLAGRNTRVFFLINFLKFLYYFDLLILKFNLKITKIYFNKFLIKNNF